jgi:ABC-type amino acid transport system permease subunit
LAKLPDFELLAHRIVFSASMVSKESLSSHRSFGYSYPFEAPLKVILYKVLFYVLAGYVFGVALGFLLRVLRVIGACCFWLRFWVFDRVLRITVVLVVIFGCIFLGLMLFFWSFFPLSVPIFCAEHRHKRISTAIGARAGTF